MAEFFYHNAKNTNTSHTLFELNYEFRLPFLLKKGIDFCSKSYFANKLAKQLRELIKIYY